MAAAVSITVSAVTGMTVMTLHHVPSSTSRNEYYPIVWAWNHSSHQSSPMVRPYSNKSVWLLHWTMHWMMTGLLSSRHWSVVMSSWRLEVARGGRGRAVHNSSR